MESQHLLFPRTRAGVLENCACWVWAAATHAQALPDKELSPTFWLVALSSSDLPALCVMPEGWQGLTQSYLPEEDSKTTSKPSDYCVRGQREQAERGEDWMNTAGREHTFPISLACQLLGQRVGCLLGVPSAKCPLLPSISITLRPHACTHSF